MGRPHTRREALALAVCWRGPRHLASRPLRPRNCSVPADRPRHRGGGPRPVRQCGPGAGQGPPPATVWEHRRRCGSSSGGPRTAPGAGQKAARLLGGRDAGRPAARAGALAAPPGGQGGARLPRFSPCPTEARGPSQRGGTREPGRDGAGAWRREDAPRLPRARLVRSAGRPLLPGSRRWPKEPSGCRAGPWPRGRAQLGARGGVALAGRRLGTLPHAAGGAASWHAGEARAGRAGREPPQAQPVATPRDGAAPGPPGGVVRLGR